MTASSSTSTLTSRSETASGSSGSGVDIKADLPSAGDKAKIPNRNEAAAPSSRLPRKERPNSLTQFQKKKISHVRYSSITRILHLPKLTYNPSSLYKDYVYVDVGRSKQRFSVHKGLVCHRSKFFDAAFNGSFSEASTGIVTLTEEDPEIFDIVHTWLYTNQLTQSKDGQDVECSFEQCRDVFVLADRLVMPLLCNMAIDWLKDFYLHEDVLPSAAVIIGTYAITPENSVIRKLLVALITFAPTNWRHFSLVRRKEYVKCPDFLLDVSIALEKQITHRPAKVKDAPFFKEPCSFHHHAEGEKDCSGKIVPRSGETQG